MQPPPKRPLVQAWQSELCFIHCEFSLLFAINFALQYTKWYFYTRLVSIHTSVPPAAKQSSYSCENATVGWAYTHAAATTTKRGQIPYMTRKNNNLMKEKTIKSEEKKGDLAWNYTGVSLTTDSSCWYQPKKKSYKVRYNKFRWNIAARPLTRTDNEKVIGEKWVGKRLNRVSLFFLP